VLAGVDPTGAQRFTPSCLDSLALGALLALLEERGLPWRRPGLLPACALVGAAGVAMRPLLGWTPAVAVWTPLGTSLLSFALVAGAARGFAGPAGRLLSLRPIVYLGKISYGLYVLHLPILGWAVPRIEAHLGDPLRERPGALALVGIALSVAAAAASWHAFERPLNQLKRRFR
jgi:peptidoglycan/LPS O-acetylase OafA/YrhL